MCVLRAAIYARCSTEEESQRDALALQAEEARECVRCQGWMLTEEYVESRSGTSTKGRKEYNRLYDDLSKNKFDILVIKSQDRLMRNTKDWYLFVDRMAVYGKKLYMYIEQKFYTPDDSLLTGIKAILAEDYSRELSKKINNAHYNRQKTGRTVLLTNQTYGYRKLPDKSVVIEEQEAKVKRKMYQLCAAGYGSRKIAEVLRLEGIVNRKGNPFSDSDIRRMIRSPINKGTVVMRQKHYDFESKQTVKLPCGEQFVFEDRIPAIVSKELWQKANDAITKRYKKQTKKCKETKTIMGIGVNKGKHCFSGKLYCGFCQSPYYRTSRKNYGGRETIRVWSCRTYVQQGKKCRNIHLKEEELFHVLCGVIHPIKKDWERKLLCQMEKFLKKIWQEEKRENKYEDEKGEIECQMKVLLDKLLKGVISDERYKKRQAEYESQLEELSRREIAAEKTEPDRWEHIFQKCRDFLCGAELQKALAACAIQKTEKAVVYPDKIYIFLDEKKIAVSLENLNPKHRKK